MSRNRGRIAAAFGVAVVASGVAASVVKANGSGGDAMGAYPMIGEITLVAFDFAPRGYADANGAILTIDQNRALFSLYGTMYGGDGSTTFGLPKMDPPLPGLRYVVAVQGDYPQRP